MDYDKYRNPLNRRADYLAWHTEEYRLRGLFRDDLAAEYGIAVDHPKLECAFALAWDYGHADGYASVEDYFADFVELIR